MWVKISTYKKRRINFDSKVSLERGIHASKKRIQEIDYELNDLNRLLKLMKVLVDVESIGGRNEKN